MIFDSVVWSSLGADQLLRGSEARRKAHAAPGDHALFDGRTVAWQSIFTRPFFFLHFDFRSPAPTLIKASRRSPWKSALELFLVVIEVVLDLMTNALARP